MYKLKIGTTTHICKTIYTEQELNIKRATAKKPMELHVTIDNEEITCPSGFSEIEFLDKE